MLGHSTPTFASDGLETIIKRSTLKCCISQLRRGVKWSSWSNVRTKTLNISPRRLSTLRGWTKTIIGKTDGLLEFRSTNMGSMELFLKGEISKEIEGKPYRKAYKKAQDKPYDKLYNKSCDKFSKSTITNPTMTL